ncbi:hypothetical protein MTO96_019938 [Rhipicephalus appendiculatus]
MQRALEVPSVEVRHGIARLGDARVGESPGARVTAPCRLSCAARSSSYRRSRTGTVRGRGVPYTEYRLSRRYRLRARHFPAAVQGSDGEQRSTRVSRIVAHFLSRYNRCARDVRLATAS